MSRDQGLNAVISKEIVLLFLLYSKEYGVAAETKHLLVTIVALALAYVLLQALNEGTSSNAVLSGAWNTTADASVP